MIRYRTLQAGHQQERNCSTSFVALPVSRLMPNGVLYLAVGDLALAASIPIWTLTPLFWPRNEARAVFLLCLLMPLVIQCARAMGRHSFSRRILTQPSKKQLVAEGQNDGA